MPARLLHTDASLALWLCDYAPGCAMPPHEHGGSALSVVLEGHVWERVGRSEEIGGPFSLVVKPAGVRHENRFGPRGARMLQVAFAADVAEAAGLRAWVWGHGSALAVPVARLVAAARRADAGEDAAGDLDDALGALAEAAGDVRPVGGAPPRWLRAVRERLHDEAAEAPSVAALAALAGVHRVTLARTFRRHLGCSASGYLRRLRVNAAAAALATTDAPIVHVALDAGFADQSHLTRAMKRAVGTTPARFRAEVRAGRYPRSRPARLGGERLRRSHD